MCVISGFCGGIDGSVGVESREKESSVPASGGGRWQPLALERVRDHLSVRLWVLEKVKNFSAVAERKILKD